MSRPTLSAFSYFVTRSSANRVRSIFSKLRRPRYLIGILGTFAYFWFLFFRNPAMSAQDAEPDTVSRNVVLGLGGITLLQVVLTWLVSSTGRGIIFRESEVNLLFPAPLTRRRILAFKWLQSQLPLTLSALFMAALASRFGDLSFGFLFFGLWLSANFFFLHSTFAGLLLSHWKHGPNPIRNFTWLPGVVILAVVAMGMGAAWNDLGGSSDAKAFVRLLEHPVAAAILWPFTVFPKLAVSPDLATLGTRLFWPLALIVTQMVVIYWADFRFEDQAVAIAGKVTRLKTEGLDALRGNSEKDARPLKSAFTLAPTGPAWRAIVWKNVLSLGRLPRRTWIGLVLGVVMMALMAGLVALQDPESGTRSKVGLFILIGLSYGSLLAPAIVRVDLRIDIPHFDILKAMPLRGRQLVFGEVMGSVLVLFAVQAALLLVAAALITRVNGEDVGWVLKAPILAGLVPGFFALDFAILTGENLAALWFPSFVRLGRGIRQGVDQFGQNMLGAIARLLVFAVLLFVPALVGVLVAMLFH
ncbi:MAG: hypothetical protein KDB18_10435, partial [Salinibacterium sp.]|nr:hypothetical protein [Salinibacterium sp.]